MAFECISDVTVEEDTGESLALYSKVQDTDDSVAFGDTEKNIVIEYPCEERLEEAMFENSEDHVAFGDTSKSMVFKEVVDTEDPVTFGDTSKSMVFEDTSEEVVDTEVSVAFADASKSVVFENTSEEVVDTEHLMALEANFEDTGYYATFEAEFNGVEHVEATFEDAICRIESVISLQGTNDWGNFPDTEDCIELPTVTHDDNNSAVFTGTENTMILRDTESPMTTQDDGNSAGFTRLEDTMITMQDTELLTTTQDDDNSAVLTGTDDTMVTSRDTELPTVTHDDNSAGLTRLEDTMVTSQHTELPTTTQDDNSAVFKRTEDPTTTLLDSQNSMEIEPPKKVSINLVTPFLDTGGSVKCTLSGRFAKESFQYNTANVLTFGLQNLFEYESYLYLCHRDYASPVCRVSGCSAKLIFYPLRSNMVKCVFGSHKHPPEDPKMLGSIQIRNQFKRILKMDPEADIDEHLKNMMDQLKKTYPERVPAYRSVYRALYMMKRHAKTKRKSPSKEVNIVHNQRSPKERVKSPEKVSETSPAALRDSPPLEPINLCRTNKTGSSNYHLPSRPILKTIQLNPDNMNAPLNTNNPMPLSLNNHVTDENCPPYPQMTNTLYRDEPGSYGRCIPSNYSHFSQPPFYVTYGGSVTDSHGRCVAGDYSHLSQPQFHMTYRDPVTDSHGRFIANYSHLSQPLTCGGPITDSHGRCIDGNSSLLSQLLACGGPITDSHGRYIYGDYSHLSQSLSDLTCRGPVSDSHGRCISSDYSHLSQPQSDLIYSGPVSDSHGRCISSDYSHLSQPQSSLTYRGPVSDSQSGDYSHVSEPYLTCSTRVRDQHDSFGTYIVDRLRKMDEKTALDVKKAIESTIRDAEMGKFKDIEDHEAWL